MASLRAAHGIRVLALFTLVLSLTAFSGTRLLRSRRSGWDGRPFAALRARANDLFQKRRFADAAEIYEQGYRRAVACHDSLSALRFLNNLGATQYGLLRYRPAIDAFIQARKLAQSMGDYASLSATCANLCSLYIQVGDINAATTAAEQGLKIPSDRSIPYRSQLLVTLGLLASHSGDGVKALDYFREAVKEAEPRGTDAQRFEAWSNYAQQLLLAADFEGAETAALNSYRLGRLGTVRDLRPALLMLARIRRALGDPDAALTLVDRGLAIPPRNNDHRLWRRYFLYERAMVLASQGHTADAASALQAALMYARRWRETIGPSDSLRSGAEFGLKDLYDAYIDATTKSNSAVEAFLAVEEERSASLVQMLREPRANDRRWPDTYWEDLARLRAGEIAHIVSPSARDERRLAQIRQRLSDAESHAGASFISASNENHENILSRDTLPGVQRNIGTEEAILSMHSGDSASFLWALTSDRLEMHRLAPREELTRLAERFRGAVEDGTPDRERLGAQLYAALFGDLSPAVLAKTSWIVTSDDSLFEVPFEALVVEQNNGQTSAGGKGEPVYLVERHETHRIPSALMLAGASPPIRRGPFLAVGDGIYNAADERWAAARSPITFSSLFASAGTSSLLELPRLVSSTYELQSSAAAWNSGTPPILLTGANASPEKLWPALLHKPAVIHIAAHILHPVGNSPMIDLGLGPTGAPTVLTTTDVKWLPVDGALVVMSGCSSAAGNASRGAGILGLTRAWLLAGASAVVGSRWPVGDDTGDLFRSFYSHLAASGGHSSVGSALQQAQLQMLHSRSWRSDPKYWGAFYLMARE